MNFRYTLVLLAIAVVVIGGIAVVQKNTPAPVATPDPSPQLVNVQVGNVTAFEVKSAKGDTQVTRDNGKWKLTKPEQDPNVDQAKIDGLVGQLATLKGSSVVAQSTADLKPYGLTDPADQVTLTSTGNKTDVLLIGARTLNGQSAYAMAQGGPVVSIIPSSLANDLDSFAATPPRATPTPTPAAPKTPAVTSTPAVSASPVPSASS